MLSEPATPNDGAPQPSVHPVTPPRWVLPAGLIPFALLLIAGYIAGGSWPVLLKNHSAQLIALSPINRFLLLTTNSLDAVTYYGIGLLRHVAPDPFLFLLGYWYGDRALKWLGEIYPIVQKIAGEDGHGLKDPKHHRLVAPLAFLMPNTWVSVLCGAARIGFPKFLLLNIAGTAARLVLLRYVGSVFADQIRDIADFIARYQWPATAISIGVVLVGISLQLRRGRGALLGLSHAVEELTEPEDEPA